MSTRGTIAIEHDDGTVSQIHCQWDNYLERNGYYLAKLYQNRQLTEQLVSMGDIDRLGPTLDLTVFNTRDLKQDFSYNMPRVYGSYKQYADDLHRAEFNYILRRDGQWYVEFRGEFDGPLIQALPVQFRPPKNIH